ncbi:MAG TPA: hypothetical protein VIG29_13925 [Vicinamibacteria bacterium]|jgi:hypothetical protein
MAERAGIGFSVHTGWAASVLVGGPSRAPRVLDRRRIRLADSDDTLEAEVYHRAAELSPAKASALVKSAQKAALAHALAALRTLARSHPVAAAGVLMSAVTVPEDLVAILRSHPLIHTAEGALYREALADASRNCGLEIVRIPRRELASRFASALGKDQEDARRWLAAAGKDFGPPWGRDQKDAAMAALVALVKSPSKTR